MKVSDTASDPTPELPSPGPRSPWRLEWFIALFLTVVAGGLLAYSLWWAGPPWRDEVNSIQIARMPWGELWLKLRADSSPLGHYVLLKGWLALFPADQDILAIRSFGLLVGTGCIAAFWWSGRQLGGSIPSLFFCFFFFNPDFVRSMGTVRPYGLSILFLLLAVGAWYKYRKNGNRNVAVYACCVSLLAVQTHYLNVIYLGVLWLGLTVIMARSGEWARWRRLALGVMLAAASLVPYLGILGASQSWAKMLMQSPGPMDQLRFVWQAWVPTGDAAGYIVVFAVLVSMGTLCWRKGWSEASIFGMWVGFGMLAAFLGYSFYSGNYIMPWYMAPPTALACLGLEVLSGQAKAALGLNTGGGQASAASGALNFKFRLALSCSPILVAALVLEPGVQQAAHRQTNVDLVAQILEVAAGPNDYIVVAPWFYGVPFYYFYQGKTSWQTLPPLPDHAMHRYDLISGLIATSGGGTFSGPVLQRVRQTLRSGGTVWMLGNLQRVPRDLPAEDWQVAPGLTQSQHFKALESLWITQTVAVVEAEKAELQRVGLGDLPINSFENCTLYRASTGPLSRY